MSIRCRPVSVALLGLFLWTTACSSISQIQPGEVADHDHIRVTMTDGERHDLYDPVLEADSIRRREESEASQYYSDPILSIPLDQVLGVERVHADDAGTVGTVVLVIAGSFAVLFGIALIACC